MCQETKQARSDFERERAFKSAGNPQNDGAIGLGAEPSDRVLTAEQEEDFYLREIFRYHPPGRDQLPKYEHIREAAKHFAKIVLLNVSPGADRDAAIRKIREAVMTANAGVALSGFSL